jgi:hypothetical protein
LANRFRVLLYPINFSPQKVEVITLCCVVLHNFLVTKNKIAYCAVKPEDTAANHLQQVTAQSGNRNSFSSREVQDEFRFFYNRCEKTKLLKITCKVIVIYVISPVGYL